MLFKKVSIEEIIIGCRKEQTKYQRMLVDKYSDMLYAICLRYMRNPEEARDQLQESLLRILKNMDKFSAELGSIEAWMSTITIRQCLKKLDRKKVHIVQLDHNHDQEYHAEPDVLDQFNTRVLLDLIQQLPDGYREVFNLAAIDGFSHEEIAQQMGIQVSSSRSRLSRARAMLKESIHQLKSNESWVNIA